MIVRLSALLAACAAPLLVQAQSNCPTGDNTDESYILGTVANEASAMHWPTGLVWKRCIEGRSFSGGQCTTGTDATASWNDWAETLLPNPFLSQENWGIAPAYSQNLLESGGWRMAYRKELTGITTNCGDYPKVNRTVFPDTPNMAFWSAELRPDMPEYAYSTNFSNGNSSIELRYANYRMRLVRGGQPFANLTSPPAQDAVTPGATVTFPAFPLAATVTPGQAWGGARISGDGSPEFQINGAGAWVQEAIVKSGDQITVRVTAPATGSHSATFTLRSSWNNGTADHVFGGEIWIYMRETTASFTASAPVNGACGTAHGVATLLAPASNLCSVGTATAASSADGQHTWQCTGSSGGAAAQCAAPGLPAQGGSTNHNLTFALTGGAGCVVESATPVAPATGLPGSANMPYGALDFTLNSCTGGSATVTVTYSGPVADMQYWKHINGGWTPMTSGVVLAGNTATITIVDDGPYDADTTTPGRIRDPSGPVLLASSVAPIPTLSQWTTLGLAGLTGLLALGMLRRRRS